MRATGTRGFCVLQVAGLVGELDDATLAALERELLAPAGHERLIDLLRWSYALPDELREELTARLRQKVAELRGLALVRAGDGAANNRQIAGK